MKIFSGLHNICGYYSAIEAGFTKHKVTYHHFDITYHESCYKSKPFPSILAQLINTISFKKRVYFKDNVIIQCVSQHSYMTQVVFPLMTTPPNRDVAPPQ